MKLKQIELGKTVITVGSLTKDLVKNVNTQHIDLVDVLELRLDLFNTININESVKIINSLKTSFGKPTIATIRAKHEGSPSSIDDNTRYKMFQAVVPLVDAIDIELSSVDLAKKIIPLCKQNNTLLIGSYHNFEATPKQKDLEDILEKSKKMGVDITKVAAMANSKEDVAALTEFTAKNKDKNIITISLGSIGLISRIVNPLFGSLMTYGYIDKTTAPGQISIFEIINDLRFYDGEYNQNLINNSVAVLGSGLSFVLEKR